MIFTTNLATSYAAGRLAQLRDPELHALKPYWMYQHNDSVLNPRPLHVSWDGLTLPADHPWFKTHYPPNGWGCRCRVVAVSQAEAQCQGGRITDAPPDDGTTTQNGETIPSGIDYGWDYMPGDTAADGIRESLARKLTTHPEALGAALATDLAAWMKQPQGLWPIAVLSEADAPLIGTTTKIVHLSAETVRKQLETHPDLTPAQYVYVQAAISRDQRIQDTPVSLIYLLEEDGYVTVVKATESGRTVFMTSFRRLHTDQGRWDREIRRLLRKRQE